MTCSDLWREERSIVARIASTVPDDGTIVEIGTFLGGTAEILYKATRGRGVGVYTIDIAPHKVAYENLKDTNVEIIVGPSMQVAQTWTEPIDLLFIDGSHRFCDTFGDFNSWVGLLKPGGTIIFHDYDPIERGGLVHLGVKICIDGILKNELLKEPKHEYKLLYGTSTFQTLDIEACVTVFNELGRRLVCLREQDYSTHMPLTVSHNDLEMCYIMDSILKTDFEYLYGNSCDRAEFWRLAETLSMIDEVYGKSSFPNKAYEGNDVLELSKLITREQIKLNMLARTIKTFVDWTP